MTSAPVVSVTDELLAEIEQEARDGGFTGSSYTLALTTELRRLRAEVEELRQADEMSKKALALIWRQKVDKIKSHCLNASGSATNWQAVEIEHLRAEVQALRVDAGRYQWLRDEALNLDVTAPAIMVVDQSGNPVYRDDPWNSLLCSDDADAAIDTAMQSNTEGN